MLSASGTTSTVSATTTGTVTASIVGALLAKIQIAGVSSYTYPVQVFVAEGLITPIPGDSRFIQLYSGSVGALGAGVQVHVPKWGTQYTVLVTTNSNTQVVGSTMFSTPAYVPGAPVITKVTPTVNSVTLTWAAVPNASSYNVFKNGVLVLNTTALTYTAGSLTPATQYSFGVQAVAPDVV